MRPSKKLRILARNLDAPGYPWRSLLCDKLSDILVRIGL